MTKTIPSEVDLTTFVKRTNHRLDQSERVQQPIDAATLLGPGMSAQAVNILDWNDEVAQFNGFFYSFAGAYNTPVIEEYEIDPATGMPTGDPVELAPMPWTGQSIARDDGTGTQQVWNTDTPDSMYYRVRNWWPNPDDAEAPVIFGDWLKFATRSGFITGDDLDPTVQDGIQTAYDLAVEAIGKAEDAIDLIPPKNYVFYQDTEPVSTSDHTLIAGDFWFDTNSVPPNRMWTYNGSAWVDPADAIIGGGATASQAAAAAAQAALATANTAITMAGASSHTYYQDAEPTGGTYGLGDTWVDTNDANKQYRWNGSAWVATITGWLQTNATANRGLKVTSTGLVAYADGTGTAAAGTPTFAIVGSTGAVSMLGDLTSGSTVSGATVTGGTVQTSASANVGVKITSTGLVAYGSGVAQTTINASNGTITTTGSTFSGGNVTGASVTASGTGVIQTESTASRGIKMNSAGLVAYNASGSATFTILASDGSVSMLGNLISGSSISGATINSSTFTTTGGSVTATLSGSSSPSGNAALSFTGSGFFHSLYSNSGALTLYSNNSLTVTAPVVGIFGALTLSPFTAGGANFTGAVDMNSNNITGVATATIATINGGPTINGNPTWTAAGSGGTANVNWNNGKMQPVTSSKRYKKYIKPLTVNIEAALALTPRRYVRKDTNMPEVGFIAEEALAVGLDDWVMFDPKGAVESFDYFKWVVALQAIVQDQSKRIAALEAA